MKVLHIVFSYLPDPPGGTEIYVQGLCRALRAQGIDSSVVTSAREARRDVIDGTTVYRVAAPASMGLKDLYGAGDIAAADAFDAILRDDRPDVVHQHALTPMCSVEWARRVKRSGRPLVVTYHTPTFSCQRGTLLRWGADPCDGRLDATTCTACVIQSRGLPRAASAMIARLPSPASRAVSSFGLAGGIWTALQLRPLVAGQQAHVREFFALADRIVSLAPWVRQLLELNGVASSRIVDVRHGTSAGHARRAARQADGTLRVAHLGRLDPTKGTSLLVDAVRQVSANVTLDVFGVVQDPGHAAAAHEARSRAAGDARITFHPALAHADVLSTLASYDVVAVPSQWMETGPLVALEAFAAGVPVIGSALGGLQDKIRDGVDGLLVAPFNSIQAWSAALTRCAADPGLVATLRAGVQPPRSIDDVAREMRSVYDTVCDSGRGVRSSAAPRGDAHVRVMTANVAG